MLLANNVLLIAAAGSVLLGTLYPLFLDALNLGKISVGPPYFDAVFVPLMTPLVFLMGVGPLARWKQASASRPVAAAALGARRQRRHRARRCRSPPASGRRWSRFGLLLAGVDRRRRRVVNVRERGRGVRGGVVAQLARQPRSYWGMLLAHLGVAVFIVGVTLVKGYEIERDVRMDVGDTVAVGGYAFRFDGVTDARGPNYRAARGTFAVSRDGTRT